MNCNFKKFCLAIKNLSLAFIFFIVAGPLLGWGLCWGVDEREGFVCRLLDALGAVRICSVLAWAVTGELLSLKRQRI